MLLHICPAKDWNAKADTYVPPRYEIDGFIHLSTAAQVPGPANRLFAARQDLLLLVIDEEALDARVRWEASTLPEDDGEEFPHLYGRLNTDAVMNVVTYKPGKDGRFGAPKGLDDA